MNASVLFAGVWITPTMAVSCASCSGTMNVTATNDGTCLAHTTTPVTFNTTTTNFTCTDLIPICSANAIFSINTTSQGTVQTGSQPIFQCNGAGTGYTYEGGVVNNVCCYTIRNTISSGISQIYAKYLILACANPCTQGNLGASMVCASSPSPSVTPVVNIGSGCTDLTISCSAGALLTEHDVGGASQVVPGSPPTDSLQCTSGAYKSTKFGFNVTSITCALSKLI